MGVFKQLMIDKMDEKHNGDWDEITEEDQQEIIDACLLYTSPSPRDRTRSRMPSSA